MIGEINDTVNQIKSEEDPISKAKLINFLKAEKQLRIKDIAKLLGLSSSYVCNLLRLLRLPEAVVDGYYAKNLSLTHLMTISRLKKLDEVLSVYEKVLQEGFTVGATQDLVTQMQSDISASGDKITKEGEEKIKRKFKLLNSDLKVEVIQTRITAKVKLTLSGNRETTTKFLEELAD